MNIKALLLTGLITLGSASPALALAYPGQGGGAATGGRGGNVPARMCNFSNTVSDTWLTKDDARCTVTSRTNVNGHKVWDIKTHDMKISVVLWNDGNAEYFWNGNRYTATWSNNNGFTEVYSNNSNYTFRF